jgi:hypothetical protein
VIRRDPAVARGRRVDSTLGQVEGLAQLVAKCAARLALEDDGKPGASE